MLVDNKPTKTTKISNLQKLMYIKKCNIVPPASKTIYSVPGGNVSTVNPSPAASFIHTDIRWQYMEATSGSNAIINLSVFIPACEN